MCFLSKSFQSFVVAPAYVRRIEISKEWIVNKHVKN